MKKTGRTPAFRFWIKALDHLFTDIDWPDVSALRRWNVGLGGGGRHLVHAAIREHGAKVLLEIGVFLGQSARLWLETHPDLKVVGLDPWGDDLVEQCERYVGRETLNKVYPDAQDQADFIADVRTHGVKALALANLLEFKDRFVPIEATSPEAIPALCAAEVRPDIIYIDAGKTIEDLDVCHLFWPDAILCGDDWHWGRTKGYPMRQVVEAFAAAHGFDIEAEHATWVLKPRT